MKVVAFSGSPRKDGNTATLKCFESKDGRCALGEDIVNDCIELMVRADGIILGTPTYFADLTQELKALIDRAGAIHAFDSINHFFLISQMIIPGSSYWNIGLGLS